MNAARRAIIKEIQSTAGCTPKEAYEASKDPSWMRDWIRVSIKDNRSDGKPKPNLKRWDWRGRLRLVNKMQEIQEKKALRLQDESKRRANYLRKLFDLGYSLKEALKKADEKYND